MWYTCDRQSMPETQLDETKRDETRRYETIRDETDRNTERNCGIVKLSIRGIVKSSVRLPLSAYVLNQLAFWRLPWENLSWPETARLDTLHGGRQGTTFALLLTYHLKSLARDTQTVSRSTTATERHR